MATRKDVEKDWIRRNFYQKWLLYYPEYAVGSDDELYEKVTHAYWHIYHSRGRTAIETMSWQKLLKMYDPNYKEAIARSKQQSNLRDRKLVAIASMDDFQLQEFHISELEDEKK